MQDPTEPPQLRFGRSMFERIFLCGFALLGLILAGFGGFFVLNGALSAFSVLALLIGMAFVLLAAALWSMYTVLDQTGIHIHSFARTRDVPWPSSRTGLFARMRRIHRSRSNRTNDHEYFVSTVEVVRPDGSYVSLNGLKWKHGDLLFLERKAVAKCDEIWNWAVACGYTQETGQYIPVPVKRIQARRYRQEQRYGLVQREN